MLYAGVGLSIQKSTEKAAVEAARIAIGRAGTDRADLAVVHATTEHGPGYSLLLRRVKEITGATHVVGCGAAGVLTTDGEVERSPGVAVLAMRSDTISATRFFVPQLRGRSEEVGREIAAHIKPHLASHNLLVVFPDTYNFHPAPFFGGLRETLGDLPTVGGGASEDGSVGETFQLCGDAVSSNSVSGFLLAGALHSTIGIAQACQPIGPAHTVTKVHQNLILELDGRPAFEVFAEVVKEPLLQDLRRAAAFVFVGLPTDPERQRVARGEYLVRSLIGFDPRQGIVAIADEVDAGQKIIFTLREGSRSREDLKLTLEAQVEAWQGRKPAFGLYFNCVGRGGGLYGFPDMDTSYIKQYLGEIPVIGFFTGCEIAPIHQQSQLHQYSGVLVLVGETVLS
jgi:small ligand-binding sensory domain FIST